MRNVSYENEFCMQFHFHANQSHFHKNGSHLTRVETEAQGNSEMAHSCIVYEHKTQDVQCRVKDLPT